MTINHKGNTYLTSGKLGYAEGELTKIETREKPSNLYFDGQKRKLNLNYCNFKNEITSLLNSLGCSTFTTCPQFFIICS